MNVWWCNVLPDASFGQAVFRHWLPGLTCQILRLKEKLLDINIPKQQFEKQTQIININTPLSKFQHFRALKIVTQFRTGAKRTETARTDYEDDCVLEPGDWKQFFKHPKFQFTHKLTMNSRHNLTKSKFSEMLHRQCKVNGKLKTCKHHSLCIGDAALPKILLFVRLWRDFVVNLWVNWNLGCL